MAFDRSDQTGGRLVVSGNKGMRIWEPDSGRTLMLANEPGIEAVALDHATGLIASVSPRGVLVWERPRQPLPSALLGLDHNVYGIEFLTPGAGKNGPLIVAGSSAGAIRAWHSASGEQSTFAPAPAPVDGLEQVRTSPNGGSIAYVTRRDSDTEPEAPANADGPPKVEDELRLVGFPGGKLLWSAKRPMIGYGEIAFSHDGRRIAWAGGGTSTEVFDASTGKSFGKIGDPLKSVAFLAYSADNSRLVALELDEAYALYNSPGLLRTIDAATGKAVGPAAAAYRWMGLSSDGSLAASTTEYRGAAPVTDVYIWDTAKGQVIATLRGHAGTVMGVAFERDRQMAATIQDNGVIRLWDIRTGRNLCSIPGPARSFRAIQFSPDGRQLAVGGADGQITLFHSTVEGIRLSAE